MASEGEIEGINHGGFRNDGGIVIVEGSVNLVIAREGVGGGEFGTREDFPDDVEVLQEKRPSGLPTRELTGIL